MSHQEIFEKYVNELNEKRIQYVFVRGFLDLPQALDTDVDIVAAPGYFDEMTEISKTWLTAMLNDWQDFGFAEWCHMLYRPYHTDVVDDPTISNGRFRVDTYNSLYFLSPYNNFQSNWTLPRAFSSFVIEERRPQQNYFIPRSDHEIALLVCRDVFDKKGEWSPKHISRIQQLLPETNLDNLISTLREISFPGALVVDELVDNRYERIFNIIMGIDQ